ncbi:hypothetical protein BT96DRAFT_939646 [Gymnopus androsaceus JB14]|uniref:Uncharacterized protein n=1 Tax=Gymnopus androsaceus JB14 TaxID=1447944 RepID=A0A6A4HQ09_9AGAR|nr:hypothetical protein BT96DRAFT_939646 [Gymnopus androsaceus JB14]
MTPQESEQIAAAEAGFFQNIPPLIFMIGLFAPHLKPHHRQKENNGWAHKALIALLLVGAVMVVLTTCANIAANLLLVKFSLVVSLSSGDFIAQEMAANLKAIVMFIVEDISENSIFLFADTAIVWRAWALWAENRLVKWTLFIILLADIDYLAITIADSIVDTEGSITSSDLNTVTLDWLSTVFNLTVNIVATLLIAYRAWAHYKSTRAILHNKKTQVETILLLMVESGAIFGMVQLSNIIIQALDLHATSVVVPIVNARIFIDSLYLYSAWIIQSVFFDLKAINPVALIILIQTGNTHEHSIHLEDISSLDINSVPMSSNKFSMVYWRYITTF